MKDVTPAELSKAEATQLTRKIKTAVNDVWALLVRAREGKAWKALKYSTWEDYVKTEFGMSRRRAGQLLEKGEVVEAIEVVTGKSGNAFPLSKRDVDALKDDLPTAASTIKAKVEAGENPEKAVADTVAAARAGKEKAKADLAALQAENDRLREQHAAALPQAVKDHETAKAEAIAARKAKPVDVEALTAELEELREANDALETEITAIKADNAKWEAMRVQFEQGGFEKVIAGKDEEIRVLKTRVATESQEKVRNLNSFNWAMKKLTELGFRRNAEIDIETGEVLNG
ncbi:hypothetical protein [Mesorhizobium sp. Root552]|uniref:hypothetical protein n=1 Tax=Mesorhizobium sp. Root552 TaxID=1736555 RepID=UPI000AE54905|nr:hypothetical protein [Mesorhizobium sp. Root552]